MTMIGWNKTVHDVQPRVAGWIKHAAEDRSPQAEAAVRWALSRLEDAKVPEVVHAVVLTLTGNQKAAKQARRAAETAVRRAERRLRRTHQGHGKAWLAAGLLAAAVAAGVIIWRGPPGSGEPEAAQAGDHPTDLS
jgi:glutathione S-transferase